MQAMLPWQAMRRHLPLVLSLPLSGCTPGARPCSALPPGLERDKCSYQELLLLDPEAAPEVLETAGDIGDPIVRDAAVTSWLSQHVDQISDEQGKQLCLLLDEEERGYCFREHYSPHLRR